MKQRKSLFKEVPEQINTDMNNKQNYIINAAIEVFSEKGFSASTTSEIAKKAGVAEGTIFRYYKTKKALLLSIPEYICKLSLTQNFIQEINSIIKQPHKNFEDFLKAVIINRKNFAAENFSLIKVLFQEIPFYPELRAKALQNVLLPAIEKLIEAVDKYKVEGKLIDIPSSSIVNLIFTSLFGYFFTRYIAGVELNWDNDKEIDYLVQFIMNGISAK